MTEPLFSILTPVYDPPIGILEETIAAVVGQEFRDWEWVVVDDCSPNPKVREVLRRAAAREPRIRLVERPENGHIVKATNDALAHATGEFIALLDHDDLLTPDALAVVAVYLADAPDVDYAYTDEVFVTEDRQIVGLFAKPEWSPERLRGQMYTGHLSIIRRTLVAGLGGFREGFDGAQDHDLVLRVTEQSRRILHVPHAVYQWRQLKGSVAESSDAKPYAYEAAKRALTEHLERTGIRGHIEDVPDYPGHYHVIRDLDPAVTVSVVIPTAFQEGIVWGRRRTFVVEAVRSLLTRNDHPAVEVVIVHDTPPSDEVRAELEAICGDRLVLVACTRPFNFSERINVGAVASSGQRLVLLNDDVESAVDGWLTQLVAPLDDPTVGLTGSLLLFADSTVQHAGHAYEYNVHYHPYRGASVQNPGRMADMLISHEVSGVTAAAAALRRETFFAVGGMCEELPNNYNDVDFSLKVAFLGLRNVYVATSRLFHFESKSRDPQVATSEKRFITDRWGVPERDPFYPDLLKAQIRAERVRDGLPPRGERKRRG